MIATVFALAIGAVIGAGTLILFVMVLAHVQSEDNLSDWRSSHPNDSLDTTTPSTPQEAQEPPYPK